METQNPWYSPKRLFAWYLLGIQYIVAPVAFFTASEVGEAIGTTKRENADRPKEQQKSPFMAGVVAFFVGVIDVATLGVTLIVRRTRNPLVSAKTATSIAHDAVSQLHEGQDLILKKLGITRPVPASQLRTKESDEIEKRDPEHVQRPQ